MGLPPDMSGAIKLPQPDPASPLPLYHQIFESLSRQIHSGEIPNGFKLPAEIDIAEQLGVSRITVKRALNELASTGLVTRKRGRGTQVTLNTALVIKGGITDMKSNIVALRKRTEARILERTHADIPEAARNALRLPADTPIEKITHMLVLNHDPISITSSYVPAAFSADMMNEAFECETMITIIEKSGVVIKQVDQILSAIGANSFQAKTFGIKPAAPLLQIQGTMIDRSGQPRLYVTSCFQPEFYRYEMTLT